MNDTVRVLIAEDEAPLRGALAELIVGEPDLELVGEASDADEAILLAAREQPDVAVVDVRMPGGGVRAVEGIAAESPPTRTLAFSAYEDTATVVELLHAGAVGYVVKGASPDELLEAVRRAVRGQASVSADLIAELVAELDRDGRTQPVGSAPARDDEERLGAVLEAAPEALVIVDRTGHIVLVNRQTERLFGYSREELLGRRVEVLVPERYHFSHVQLRAGYFEQPTTRHLGTELEFAARRKDGSEFPADIAVSAAETPDGPLAIAFVRDVTERKAAEELRRRSEQLHHVATDRRALLEQLVNAAEDERQRIAADIHDDSIQAMTAAGMRLQIMRRRIDDPEQLRLLGDLEEAIGNSIRRLRHLMFDLHPPALDRDGLAAAARTYLSEAPGEPPIDYRLHDELREQPPPHGRVILYRILQEAVTNARKHSGARTVEVTLAERDRGFVARIHDDGRGFDPDLPLEPGHLGLPAMRERADLAGGWLRIDSAPGRGTTVEAWIPALDAADESLSERAVG